MMKRMLTLLLAIMILVTMSVQVAATESSANQPELPVAQEEPMLEPETVVTDGIEISIVDGADSSVVAPAASYPLIYLDTWESNLTIPQGQIAKLKFTIFPEFKNERYNVEIYDSNGRCVATASNTIYNTSIMYKTVTITVNTNKLDMGVGDYTIKYWMEFYSLYQWNTAPNSYTARFKVVSNVCNGNHNFKQDAVVDEPTCKEEGTARMKCSKCGHTVYETLPVSDHDWNGGLVSTDPTDFDTGVYTYTCNTCGKTKTHSIPALKTAPAKPYKIANVVSGVHVYWDAVEGAQKYGLWRSETGRDGDYKWVANPTVPHFTDTKVESGKTYFYKVTILNVDYDRHTDKSEAIGIAFTSTPDISSRLNTAAGIKLGWEKISGATGYAIYRKSYSGTDAWVRIATIDGGDTLTWTDTSVKNNNGEVYKYTIRALYGTTLSGCRNAGRTMVRLSSQVLKSAAKASSTSVKCNWTTSSRVTGYEVRFTAADSTVKTFTVGNYKTGTKTFTGLTAGQEYTVQVRTYKKVDGVGSFYSDWSTAKTVKT